jgi:hypothetical protein
METLQHIEPVKSEVQDIQAPDAVTTHTEDIAYLQLKGFFGVETGNQDTIRQIYDFIDGGRNLDIASIMWEIKNLESRIGVPPLGMSRLQHLTNYIKIESQIRSLQKQQLAYGTK